MARARTEKERRVEELKLLLSQADDRVVQLKSLLAAAEAEEPGTDGLPAWKAIDQVTGQEPGLPPTLEQCKATIRSLPDAVRQQLVLWIARGMPKGE